MQKTVIGVYKGVYKYYQLTLRILHTLAGNVIPLQRLRLTLLVFCGPNSFIESFIYSFNLSFIYYVALLSYWNPEPAEKASKPGQEWLLV